jgi:hypothetical protein
MIVLYVVFLRPYVLELKLQISYLVLRSLQCPSLLLMINPELLKKLLVLPDLLLTLDPKLFKLDFPRDLDSLLGDLPESLALVRICSPLFFQFLYLSVLDESLGLLQLSLLVDYFVFESLVLPLQVDYEEGLVVLEVLLDLLAVGSDVGALVNLFYQSVSSLKLHPHLLQLSPCVRQLFLRLLVRQS